MNFKKIIVPLLGCLLLFASASISTTKSIRIKSEERNIAQISLSSFTNSGEGNTPSSVRYCESPSTGFYSRYFTSNLSSPAFLSYLVRKLVSYHKAEQIALFHENPPLYIVNQVIII